MRHQSLSADSQIDRWADEDFHSHDFISRAKKLINFPELARDPIVLRGVFDQGTSDRIITGGRMGEDGLYRATPLAATVILCSASQLGIYQAGVDLITGNRVNERVLEVFYQDVVSIGVVATTETIDTESAIKAVGRAALSVGDRQQGISHKKLQTRLVALKRRFESDIVAGILQREARKTYRIDFSDGQQVSIPITDGRSTRQANAQIDAETGDVTAQAMALLRHYIRDKKRALLTPETAGGAPLV